MSFDTGGRAFDGPPVSGATDPNSRRLSRRLMALFAVALMVLGTLAYLGLRSPSPANARAFIPSDVRAAVVAPRLSALHTGVSEFLVHVEGASGLIDLLSAQVGVDLSSLASLEAQGVSSEGSLVVYRRGGSTVLLVSITSLAQFNELFRERVVPGLGAELVANGAEDRRLFESAAMPLGLGLAWGSMHRGLGTVILSSEVASLETLWTELSAVTHTPLAPPTASGLVWAIGDYTPQLPSSLGPARLVLSSYISPLSRWTGSLTADGQGMRLTLHGAWQGSGAPPLSFFHTEPQGKPLRSYLPSASTVLVSGTWRPQSISSLPAWIRTSVLPERLPGLAGETLPPTRELLELVHGDLAVAVFGLSRTHAVDLSRMPGSLTEIMTKLLGVGFFVRSAQGDRVAGILAAVAEALAERGWRVTPIKDGPWIGFDLHTSRPEQHWALVALDDVAALVTASELPTLVEVARKSALPHGKDTIEEGRSPTLALHLSFERISRELASRGVPPYFLTMLSGIDRAVLEMSLHDKGIELTVEVGL
jgi:hypothetical protein